MRIFTRRTRRLLRAVLLCLAALLLGYITLYLWHRPFRAAPRAERFELLAHRGVYQRYSKVGLDNQSCTASRIEKPTHKLLENTPQSIAAALAAGANRIEIDLHLSLDGELMVFHDWTLDCRTEGHGETRQHTLAQLKQLDIGYGYTADGGQTFPFRGQFVGAMPTLAELLQQFPSTHFLLNQKDPSPQVTQALIRLLINRQQVDLTKLCLQSTAQRNAQFESAFPGQACTWSDKPALKRCYLDYLARPFSAAAPPSCANKTLIVPDWLSARLAWGWPGSFVERMHAVNSRVLVYTDDPARAQHYRNLGFDGAFTDWVERWGVAASPR
jgi:glycerophosphoryl diester phosphodiesterase